MTFMSVAVISTLQYMYSFCITVTEQNSMLLIINLRFKITYFSIPSTLRFNFNLKYFRTAVKSLQFLALP